VHAAEGSFGWLCDQYMDSTDFKSKAPATRAARRRIIVTMMKEPLERGKPETFGQERAKLIGRSHVRVLRDRKADNPNAANERLKILSQIFKVGVSRGWTEVNPVREVERLRTPRGGHDTATDGQIDQYLAHHTDGPAWLAMMILKNTGIRISDLRVIGRQHVRQGHLVFRTVKTCVECELEISQELAHALSGVPGGNALSFLASASGRPYESDKALSQRVAKWFRQAGVASVTAHGVRKWLATRMAENGATEYQLMAWFGWRDPKEARPYVQSASRRTLANEAALHMVKKHGGV
jgi:integrase